MTRSQQLQESGNALSQSANRYKAVNLSSVDFNSTDPFKGLHIGGDGNIVITGVDGLSVTIAVTAGVWPYGGIKITKTGTTATGIIALY
jgi:hypothetical protein